MRFKTLFFTAVSDLADAVAAQFYVETLTGEAKHFCGRCPVIASQSQGGFNTELFNQVGGFTNDFLEWHTADELNELIGRAWQLM